MLGTSPELGEVNWSKFGKTSCFMCRLCVHAIRYNCSILWFGKFYSVRPLSLAIAAHVVQRGTTNAPSARVEVDITQFFPVVEVYIPTYIYMKDTKNSQLCQFIRIPRHYILSSYIAEESNHANEYTLRAQSSCMPFRRNTYLSSSSVIAGHASGNISFFNPLMSFFFSFSSSDEPRSFLCCFQWWNGCVSNKKWRFVRY